MSNDFHNLSVNLLFKKLDEAKGYRKSLQDSLDKSSKKLELLLAERDTLEKAHKIIQLVAQNTQKQLEFRVSELVSLALSSVFDKPYSLKVEFVQRRGKTEADLMFQKDDRTVDPITASGGGAVDVASLALRVSLWSLKRHKTRPTIVLDEPLRNLTRDYQIAASRMIKEISSTLGIQFIIVSQDHELVEHCDKVFDICQRDGISKVSQRRIS